MRDETIQLPKTFPPEMVEVTRVIHGIPGSSLGRREINDTIEVMWGRETNAIVEIYINGVFVDDRSTYCDLGMLGSCIDSALEEWSELVEEYGATKDDRFEVSVAAWITDVPTLGYAEDDVFRHERYHPIPKDGSAFFIGVPEAGLDSMHPEELQTLRSIEHSRTKIRSSFWSDQENKAATAAFFMRKAEDVRTVTADPA
jgi:hypothetical protein